MRTAAERDLSESDGQAVNGGNANLTAISQMKPGHLAKGIRKPACGKTMLSELNSPAKASRRASTTIHCGRTAPHTW